MGLFPLYYLMTKQILTQLYNYSRSLEMKELCVKMFSSPKSFL